MHFEGRETINAPMSVVWDFFLTPQRVAECAPGFQSMEILSPEHFKPKVGVGIGAVKANFTLDILLTDLRAPDHAGMKGHGVAAGSAVDMVGSVDLVAESESVTRLDWVADVNVSGTLASVGGRLLESTARKMTAKFFGNTREKLEASTPTVKVTG
jgi:carbon monoxide dehydrogenase subunit G